MMDVPLVAGRAASSDIARSTARARGTIRLIVSGALDRQGVLRVRHSVIDALRHHRPARIDLDLLTCTVVDSDGVHGLRVCRADASQLNCRLVVVHAFGPNRRILHAAGLVEPTCAGAMAESIESPGPRCHGAVTSLGSRPR